MERRFCMPFQLDSAIKLNLPRARRTLEQRRRPTVKLQSPFALSRGVTMSLASLQAPLISVCSEAETHRLRCGRVPSRAFYRSQLRNPGAVVQQCEVKFDFAFSSKQLPRE